MTTNVGRGILAPRSGSNIRDGAAEMRTLGATAAAAINDVDLRVGAELAQKIGKTEAYEHLVPRDEAVRYGIPGPRGLVGPASEVPGPPGPGGSIALEETDPGCFVDSEITWLQWDGTGTQASAWNPVKQEYQPIEPYDSKWRDITQSLAAEPSSGQLLIRREGKTVYIQPHLLTYPENASWISLGNVVPPGFRPPRDTDIPIAKRGMEDVGGSLRITSSGIIYIYLVRGGIPVRAMGNYLTDNPIPTSPPGIPA